MKKIHTWQPDEDALAFYLYRFPEDDKITKTRVANYIGILIATLQPRISDYGKLEKNTPNNKTCEQERDIYKKYVGYKQNDFREKCLEILKNE